MHLMPESSALRIAESCSVNSGSTLVCMETSCPRASAALSLTGLLVSCRALRNVVWSWGRNGFRAMPTYRKQHMRKILLSQQVGTLCLIFFLKMYKLNFERTKKSCQLTKAQSVQCNWSMGWWKLHHKFLKLYNTSPWRCSKGATIAD